MTSIIALMIAGPVSASTVDLTSWVQNDRISSNSGIWTVTGAANDSAFQSRNSNPSILYNPNSTAQGQALEGTITVENTVDDDYIGFVLGYQENEINSSNGDFWLIDWKQGDQGPAAQGLALSHVSGDISNSDTGDSSSGDWWAHNGVVNEVARGTNLGSTGWNDNQTYSFDLVFTSSLIEVYVDDILEISYSGTFTDGAFGFYNYSQEDVRYSNIAQTVVTPPPSAVPLPASMPLLAAGFGLLTLARRKRS